MKPIIVEIADGSRYGIELGFFNYKVICVRGEHEGWLGKEQTNFYTKSGENVYKANRYYTLENALSGIDAHSRNEEDLTARQRGLSSVLGCAAFLVFFLYIFSTF